MWPFSTKISVSDLATRVLRLEEQIERESLDWKEMAARCKRFLDRAEKAASRAAQPDDGTGPEVPLPSEIHGVTVQGASGERLERIRRQLAQRKGAA